LTKIGQAMYNKQEAQPGVGKQQAAKEDKKENKKGKVEEGEVVN